MFKILNSQSKSITGAAIILAGATLINKFVGIARDRTIAHYFGTGAVTDAYYAAFKIPDLIYNLLVVGALTAGFIPVFTKLFYKSEDKTPAWKMASNVINIIGLSLIILSGLGMIFAPRLSTLIAPGFAPENFKLVADFTRIMFLSPILLGLSMVVGGILQSVRRFVLYSIAPIFYNIGIIIGAAFLVPLFGPIGLAWGVVLGAFLHFIIQLIGAIQAGYHWQFIFNLKDANTRLIGKLMIPRTLGLAVSNLNTIVTTILASLLPAGSVAAYSFADNLQWVPIGIIGVSFSLAVFPVLSSAAAVDNHTEFSQNLISTARQILFFIIPTSVIFLLLRAQIVRVILGSGAFDWDATINTADALAFFALGLFAQALIPLFARAFYALSNTKTPFIISIIASICNIAISLLLMKKMHVAGLALAASIGAIINFALLAIFLRKKIEDTEVEKTFSALYKMSGAALCMGVIIQTLKKPLAIIFNQDYFWGIFGQGAVAGSVGLAIYAVLCYILQLDEMNIFIQSLHKRWLKLRNVPTEGIAETKE